MTKTKRPRRRFLSTREDIERQRKDPKHLSDYKLGKQREKRVSAVLQELEKEGIITFVPTGNLSFGDIKKGVDFFVVYVGDTSYKVCALSVTGERWVEKHRQRHPETSVIAVNFLDTPASIKNKIIGLINK